MTKKMTKQQRLDRFVGIVKKVKGVRATEVIERQEELETLWSGLIKDDIVPEIVKAVKKLAQEGCYPDESHLNREYVAGLVWDIFVMKLEMFSLLYVTGVALMTGKVPVPKRPLGSKLWELTWRE